MNGKQSAVMWLGLLLILVRLFTTSQFKDIWATILKGNTGTFSGNGSSLPIPIIPFVNTPKGGTAAPGGTTTTSGTIRI